MEGRTQIWRGGLGCRGEDLDVEGEDSDVEGEDSDVEGEDSGVEGEGQGVEWEWLLESRFRHCCLRLKLT